MQVRSEPLELSAADHSAGWAAYSWKASCGRSTATRGHKGDCLARGSDQTCCSISSILRRCAAR